MPNSEMDERASGNNSCTPGKYERQSHSFGWAALVISLVARACGVVPHFIFGEPLPNPFAQPPEPPRPDGPHLTVGKVVIHPDRIEIDIDEVKQAAKKEVKQHVNQVKDRVGGWAKGIKKHIPLLGPQGHAEEEAVADALMPENTIEPLIEFPVAEVVPAQPPAAVVQPDLWTAGRPFLIAAVLLAIVSIPLAAASWMYEQQRFLPIMAMSCGVLAVTWQYLLVGIIIGVALAVFIYVLGHLE